MEPGMSLKISDDDEDVAYLTLPGHPKTAGSVAKTTRLLDLVAYTGPDIYLDFDKDGKLIGVEILA
jgi:uncharacterized protein YuzE